jgi:hypothetical protein
MSKKMFLVFSPICFLVACYPVITGEKSEIPTVHFNTQPITDFYPFEELEFSNPADEGPQWRAPKKVLNNNPVIPEFSPVERNKGPPVFTSR